MRGDRVLAAPLAERLTAAIGREWGVEPHRLLQPERLDDVVADLRTLSLFEPGKIVAAVESGLFAGRDAAADLLAQVREGLPFAGGADDLVGSSRAAARRLLQLLRLFDLDATSLGAARALAGLPDALFAAGRRKAGAEEPRAQLEPLLAAALAAGLKGVGEGELSLVADLLRDGLPARHLLVLVESAAPDGHPVVDALAERGALVEAGRLRSEKKRVEGLDQVVAGLAAASGARIRSDAVEELARRTLRSEDSRRGGGAVDADSAARFSAEFEKLAALAGDGPIDRALVAQNVEDRGEEAVWPILDALGEGRAEVAHGKIRRRLAAAHDPLAERLSLFGLLAGFARDLVAVAGAMSIAGVAPGKADYPSFAARIAPRLQDELEGLAVNPLAKKKVFPLHRLYLAASRFPAAELAALPGKVLETELRLKGESDDPDSALAALVMTLAGRLRRAPALGAGSRPRA